MAFSGCPSAAGLQKRTVGFKVLLLCVFMTLGSCVLTRAKSEESAPPSGSMVKSLFRKPPREYATAPLWVWNDRLTRDQIRDTMRDLASQSVKQVFVHPRPGLMTPYLSPEWFDLWKTALSEAERLDMNVWIYDENSYPSGFAGGFVPETMPESRGQGLVLREVKQAPKWSDSMVGVYRLEKEALEDVGSRVKAGETLPEARYMTASIVRAGNSPWHGGRCYVDLLKPGVTEKFLEITMGAYEKELGRHFGKRIPGVFTDEPNIRPAGGLPWTDSLPESFKARWGYDLMRHLPSLSLPVGDWRRVRHNYYQLLSELFIERWAKPFYQYCEQHRLEFTGHYWEHEWPNCLGVPDNMAMYAWHQRPAIDILMNQYQENVHAQFGNVRVGRELASVANQMGRSRTLCEGYGAGGWDLRFEDMKRIGDWLYVLGVNTLDEHLSYITIRGARKRDHPQSFSYHEPWWTAYHISAEYFARLSAALSAGRQVNRILVLEPTTTAWMFNADPGSDPQLGKLGASFQQLLLSLEKDQVEYDIGCEDIMYRHGAVAGAKGAAKLRVGRRDYDVLVLPPFTHNLNATTVKLLEQFLGDGGAVVACDIPPACVDGVMTDRLAKLAVGPGWKQVEAKALSALLSGMMGETGFRLVRQPDDKGILLHHRRQLKDGELLFLVNTSITNNSRGTVESSMRGVELWDAHTGSGEPYPFENAASGVRAQFDLPPSGSLLLFFSAEKHKPLKRAEPVESVVESTGSVETKCVEPNVLVLDFVDVVSGGDSVTNTYYYKANQFAFRKNGLPRNPWDSAVQFKDEFIRMTFPEDSGFAATYRFHLDSDAPTNLFAVVERADLYSISCNGNPVKPLPGQWWLDKAFGKIDLSGLVKPGENLLVLNSKPFSILHEIEPVYILGEFKLKTGTHGFVIAKDEPVRLGGWNEQGRPFFSAGVTYRQRFQLERTKDKFCVQLPAWLGSVARVTVNGKPAGFIAYPPWKCDITRFVKSGNNDIEVTVIGTLKNTLGPHHNGPGLGSAWPGMFQKGPESGLPPGGQYATVSYGLFKPFLLKRLQ